MKVIVYGKKVCVQCHYTKVWLTRWGIPFEYIDIEADAAAARDARKIIRDNKFAETWPLVVVSNNARAAMWSGLRLEKIKGLRETGDY